MRSNLKGMQRSLMALAVKGCYVVGGIIRRQHDAGGGTGKAEDPITSIAMKPYTLIVATTLTEAEHAGRTGIFDLAAGFIVTLPRATGSGAKYEFFCKTTITSVGMIIKVANADDVLQGMAHVAQDAADTGVTFETASTSDTFTGNGSTTGGIRGDRVIIQDLAPGLFSIVAWLSATGTEATPFSATVS